MAATTCVARPSEPCQPKIQKSMTGWAKFENPNRQFLSADHNYSNGRDADTYPSRIGGSWRYLVHSHTANSSLPPTITARSTNSAPISRSQPIHPSSDIHSRAFVLVAELLYSIANTPAAYGTLPPGYHDEYSPQDPHDDQSLARARIVSDASAPLTQLHKATSSSQDSSPTRNMDFGFDWGGSGGFQTRGKKKKTTTTTNKFDLGDSNEDKKDDSGANGAGGDDGFGGSGTGGASGAGGGDENNNNGDDDDTWGFSTGKKVTRKKTKKQLEEEEEERKRKEEEEAQAANTTNALSWADDANDGGGNEDWTKSWGGAKSKDKKKTKKTDAPPAVPDAPSATSAFQDISLDDGAPKLDFTFDNLGDTKKPESGSGFGTWGKTWDFGSIGKEEKKEETSEFGGNNPWGLGKSKKKTTTSSFDFGTDFDTSANNDLTFDTNDDTVADTKPADDGWNFGGTGKKEKKKKAVEEIKEEPEPEQKEETWAAWGSTATTKKTAVKKKKNAFDDAFALTEEEPNTNGDANFDWGFGKDKTKDLISEVGEKPNDDGDDLMSGAWGAVGKKKTSKKTTNDFSTSFDLTSNNDIANEPANDMWSTFGNKKDSKGKKNILDEFLVEEPEPANEPEPAKEPLVAWDFGLLPKDKKKKQRAMEKEGTWDARITQEMVEAEEARLAANAEAELEPEQQQEPEPVTERVAWDHGLGAKERRKLQKDMQMAGTWADRITQEMIDEEKRAAEEAAAAGWTKEPDPEPFEESPPEPETQEDATPLEDLVPWDHDLTPKEKKKKEKELRAAGIWDDRLTQDKIDDRKAANAAEEAPEPEPEPYNEPEPEADQTPLEDLRPWDFGLNPLKKKKLEKQMKLDGTWDDRLTQEKIDDMIAAAAAKAESAKEPDPIPYLDAEPEQEDEPLEEKKPWDYNLSTKDKKKVEKQMKLDGTWENRLTQEKIDEQIAAAAAKKAEQEADAEPLVEPEPEPEVVEERKPWDFGLSALEKKRLQRDMIKNGTWADRLTQEKIDEEAAAAAAAKAAAEAEPEEPPPPAVEAEPRFPWDHGLTPKEKKKKEKEMLKNGTWEDRLTQEQIDEEAAQAAAAAAAEPEPTTEEAGGWGFGWGAGKTTKTKKKSLLDPEPTPTEEKTEEGWGGSWGLGFGKDKAKKKEEAKPEPEPEYETTKEKKDDLWNYASPATTSAVKKKKDTKGAKKSDLFDSIVEEAAPEAEPVPAPAAEDDLWAQFSKPADKKTTKKSKKGEEAPPPAPSPPDLGILAEADAEVADVPSVDDFNWGGLDNGRKSSKSIAADPPAKKSASSLWGFGSSAATPKTKKEKEAKTKKDIEEKAKREAEEEERQQREKEEAEAEAKAEADRLAEEEAAEAAKSAKKTKAGKLSKTSKAVEDKKKSSDLLDLLDEPVPTPATTSSKLKKTPTRTSVGKIEEETAEEKAEATDYFSFWGATSNSKKVAGKKTPEAKKETKTPVLSNEEDALLAELNEDEIQAILDDTPAPVSPKLTRTTSSSKSARSSINNRINSFDDRKETTGKTPKTSETLISKEPEAEFALTSKEVKKATKTKSARSSKVQFETPPSPEPEPVETKKSKESVPGSFPGAFGDDDDMLNTEEPSRDLASDAEPEPAVKSKGKKSTKVEKKITKVAPKKKKSVVEESPRDLVAEPESIDELDLLDDHAPKLPTPPPEEDSKTSKPAKKERTRLERSGTASWALWGAQPTPKKPVRSKTVDDVSPPSTKATKSPPVMMRSKSTKNSRKDDLDDSKTTEPSKTSGSDKESSSKPSDKSKPSRGLTFTNFVLGTAPPSAMRSNNMVRRDSTTGSKTSSATPTRRQSVDYNAFMSPPPDESPVAKSAAKLMGFAVGKPSRRSSVKGKTNSYPDPYPIDDDDMVMVNPRAREAESTPRSKPEPRVVTDSKRDSKRIRSKTISGDEDVVMVDSPVAIESDFERPQLQRSNTSKSSKGFFGSFFGPAIKTPVEKPRSAQVTDNEETTPRNRSRNTSKRRSKVTSPADGFTTDAQGETDVDAARRRARKAANERAEVDERQARDSRRRERREREKADLEARQQRAREQARKEREAEEQRREERRARRKEKEAAERERIAQEEVEAQAAAERRREERRRKAEVENTSGKDERRRTYGGEDDLRRSRGERTKVKSSGRRSTALMAEYHESRNGSGRGIKPPADKTSSWIDSQQDEPPELPPVEGTVLDESGQQPRPVDDEETPRRRKDRYAGMTEEEIARHRAKRRERRIVEKSTSGGSDEKQQATPAKRSSKRQSRVYDDDYYAEPARGYDARPQQTKRSSFLGKFF